MFVSLHLTLLLVVFLFSNSSYSQVCASKQLTQTQVINSVLQTCLKNEINLKSSADSKVDSQCLNSLSKASEKTSEDNCQQAPTICAPESSAPEQQVIIEQLQKLSGSQRENKIKELAYKGFQPQGFSNFKSIVLKKISSTGQPLEIELSVAPDYFALGHNQSFLYMPMTNTTAQEIGDRWGLSLPTSKIVDAIYEQAEKKLIASPLGASNQMTTTDMYVKSDQKIKMLDTSSKKFGEILKAGHKKDVVLAAKKGFVSIYGWAQPGKNRGSGRMPYIQPEGGPHDSSYVDYSHGIRYLSKQVKVKINNKCSFMPLTEALKNSELCPLLSYRCPLTDDSMKAAH